MSDQNFVAGLLSKLGIKSEDAKKAAEILSDSELSKAQHATSGGPTVVDRWQEGQMHKVPAADTIKIGPVQESSGGGGEKMVSEYSNTAPQKGIQVEAERLAAELGSMRGYMKSLADHHNELVDVVVKTDQKIDTLTTVTAAMVSKAEDDEKKKEKDKEDAMHGDKACSLFAEGKKLFKKSRKVKAEAKAETDPEKQTALKSVAKLMRKAAARRLHKAQVEALAGRGVSVDYTFETRKSIAEFISKNPSLQNLVKAFHDKDDEEEDEKKKAKKAYKKAKAAVAPTADNTVAKDIVGHKDAKGNQADRKDPATGNQDDSAVKAAMEAQITEMSQKIDNALHGFGMLKTDVQGLFDVLTARPATGPLTSATIVPLLKSVGDNSVEAIGKKIDEADENGNMDVAYLMKARDLLTKLDAVNKGSIHEGIFKSALATAPTAVREFFNAA